MSEARFNFGKQGETLAHDYLLAKGYRVLERCFRCRMGEIDLIMQDGATIVFVEVKARHTAAYGVPEEAVDARKQQKIVRMAQLYLQRRRWLSAPVRFDVVAILGEELRHFPDAFRA